MSLYRSKSNFSLNPKKLVFQVFFLDTQTRVLTFCPNTETRCFTQVQLLLSTQSSKRHNKDNVWWKSIKSKDSVNYLSYKVSEDSDLHLVGLPLRSLSRSGSPLGNGGLRSHCYLLLNKIQVSTHFPQRFNLDEIMKKWWLSFIIGFYLYLRSRYRKPFPKQWTSSK